MRSPNFNVWQQSSPKNFLEQFAWGSAADFAETPLAYVELKTAEWHAGMPVASEC
jgi:hypothetical protein